MTDRTDADPVTVIDGAADAALEERAQLRAELADRERIIEELRGNVEIYRKAAEERASVIETLDSALKQERQARADVEAIRAALDEQLREIDRVTRERDALALAAEAAKRTQEDDRLRTIVAEQRREAELRAARREVETQRARAESLEATLASRGEILAGLQAAADERLALIERLSSEIDALRAAEGRAAADTTTALDWRALAEEREAALAALSAEAEKRSVLLAEVTAALHERTEELEKLRRGRVRPS